MSTVYTGTEAISGQTGPYNLVQTAYDKMVEFALRSEPVFRSFASKRPVDVDKPGSSIVLQKYQDLAVSTTPLTENVDPDAVAISDTNTVTITLNEYGRSVLSTEKLALESLSAIDPAIANLVAYNMRNSLDALVGAVLVGGTNRICEANSVLSTSANINTVGTASTDTLKSKHVRYVTSKLRGNSAVTADGGYYIGLVHPDASLDLRSETGAAAWRDPHNYSGATSIWNGEIGAYEGVRFIESPRLKQATDGYSSAKVTRTVILGQQALAEAVSREPGVVIGNVTDRLMRTRPVGWKGMLGWARYREEALFRIETATTY